MVRVPLPAREPPKTARDAMVEEFGARQLQGGVPHAEAGAVADLDRGDGCESGIQPDRHAGARDAHVRPGDRQRIPAPVERIVPEPVGSVAIPGHRAACGVTSCGRSGLCRARKHHRHGRQAGQAAHQQGPAKWMLHRRGSGPGSSDLHLRSIPAAAGPRPAGHQVGHHRLVVWPPWAAATSSGPICCDARGWPATYGSTYAQTQSSTKGSEDNMVDDP